MIDHPLFPNATYFSQSFYGSRSTMEIYALKAFVRRARKLGIPNDNLLSAVARIDRGNIDAQLGAGLIKQRIEKPGHGRSGSARAVLFLRQEHFILFMHIYLKSEQANVSSREFGALRDFAAQIASLGALDIQNLIAAQEWIRLE